MSKQNFYGRMKEGSIIQYAGQQSSPKAVPSKPGSIVIQSKGILLGKKKQTQTLIDSGIFFL